MADHRIPPQQANHISANTPPHLALPRLQGQNFNVAPDDQQGIHREAVPQPADNVVMQNEMQYPRHIDPVNYNAAYYHYPIPPYPVVHLHRDVGVAEAVPAQVLPVVPAQEFQECRDGLHAGARFHAADPPEDVHGVWPHHNPPADIPPANGLRILAGRLLNNPDTLVNMLRIEPGPDGRFEVWIALQLTDLF